MLHIEEWHASRLGEDGERRCSGKTRGLSVHERLSANWNAGHLWHNHRRSERIQSWVKGLALVLVEVCCVWATRLWIEYCGLLFFYRIEEVNRGYGRLDGWRWSGKRGSGRLRQFRI